MKPKRIGRDEIERKKKRLLEKDPLRIALGINPKEFNTIVEE